MPAPKRSRAATSAAAPPAPRVVLSGGTAYPARMIDLWRQGIKCDATVSAEGCSFEAHSTVLMCGSDFFHGALTSSMSEGESSRVSLPELKAVVVEAALAFLYTGACEVVETMLPDMLSAATYLQVAPLVSSVSAMLKERLASDNCLALWTLAEAHTLSDLAEVAKEAVLRHFETVAATEAAAAMPHGQLLALLSDERLVTEREEAVFRLVIRWSGGQQPPPDEDDLLALLSTVRYPLVARDVFEREVAPELLRQGTVGTRVACAAFVACAHGPPAKRRRGFGPSRPALTWSTEYKGEGIALAEGGALACMGDDAEHQGKSVRSAEPLPPTGTHLIEMVYERLDEEAGRDLGGSYVTGLVDASVAAAVFNCTYTAVEDGHVWGVDDYGDVWGFSGTRDGDEGPAEALTREGMVFLSGDCVGLLVDMDARRMTLQVNGERIPSLVFDNLPEQVFVVACPFNTNLSVRLIRECVCEPWV